MITLQDLDSEIKKSMLAKNQLRTDTLRGLKVRVTNQQISTGKSLTEDEILQLFKSESKRRKEAAAAFTSGSRPDLAEKELLEDQIIESFLPQKASLEEINTAVDAFLATGEFTVKDMGKVMASLKQQLPHADGTELSSVVKQKLQS